jgi:hypothetical protein
MKRCPCSPVEEQACLAIVKAIFNGGRSDAVQVEP